jgi:hypothetical protein
VFDYVQFKSVTTVQRNFRRRFGKDPPIRNSIYDWHHKFETTECLCKGKSPGRPRVSEENVQRIRQALLRSPNNSIPEASRELQFPQTTVWKVLRKHLFTSFVKILYFQNSWYDSTDDHLLAMSLPTQDSVTQNNTDILLCIEQDSKPRSQFSSGPRPCVP